MARKSQNQNVEVEFNTASKLALNEFTSKARELGNTPSEGGVQLQLAILAFAGAQKAAKTKAKWDFNTAVFCPFAANYYGAGKGGKREELKGFRADGKHEKDSTALTVLRGYNHFATAGALPYDVKPVALAILSDQRIGQMPISRKGAMLSKLIADAKGVPPKASVVAEAIEEAIPAENKGGKGKVDAVRLIKGLAASADRIAKSGKFWTALNRLDNDKASTALVNAMHFLTIARGAVDSAKRVTEANTALNGLLQKHAERQYRAALKNGATFH